jgi:hypothetical protein
MKNLKETLLLSLLLISGLFGFSQNSMGVLKGQILNNDNEPVIGATIKILQGGFLIGGTDTDEKGLYTYKPLGAGSYDLLISSVETQTKRITDVRVSSEKTTYVDATVNSNTLDGIDVVAHIKPIIDKSFIDMKEITAEEFLHMAIDRGNIVDAVVSITSEATQGSDGELHVRGGRGDATAFIVDGVRSPNITGVAALAVENVAIITGGIPAQYGDITSGVIVVTTKDYFTSIQSKRMRDNYIVANRERVKREKEALQKEKERKKQIENELKLEEEAKSKG